MGMHVRPKVEMESILDFLPPRLAELAEVIGLDAAMKLSAGWPGIRLHVPKRATLDHAITLAIGLEAAQKLCETYGDLSVVIPMATRAHRQRMHLAMLEELDNGVSAVEVARKYGVHQFSLYNLRAARKREDQGSLF